MTTLKDMYKLMNGSQISKTIKAYRERNGQIKPTSEDGGVAGAFRLHVIYAENIKAINKNGLSNPYVIIRVPENTVVPPKEDDTISKKSMSGDEMEIVDKKPVVLTGAACDLVK
jgi:hypothetical protein